MLLRPRRWVYPLFVVLTAVSASSSVVPGDPSWLGDASGGDGTVDDFNQLLPLGYVLLGPGKLAVVRVIVPLATSCPTLTWPTISASTNASSAAPEDLPQVKTRAAGDWTMPHPFPVRVCDLRLETGEQKLAFNQDKPVWKLADGGLNHSQLPTFIPDDPTRYLFLSDTGLRSRPYDLGIACNTTTANPPVLYGVPQCPLNITKDLLSPQKVRVDAQSVEDWPLTDLMEKAVLQEPDVVVFIGGALSRQGPCPASSGVKCVGINGGGYYSADGDNQTGRAFQATNESVVSNFLPGRWGDNWFGWWADFLFPSKGLLRAAPWIVARGDMESSCDAGGHGYWLLLSTDEYPDGTRAGDFCPEVSGTGEPFAVSFEQEQLLVMNSATAGMVDDLVASADGICPDLRETRRTRSGIIPTQNAFSTEADVAQERENWETIRSLSASHNTNFLVSHRPVLGLYCNNSQLFTTDSTLQQALGGNASLLDSVSGIFSGQRRLLQVIEYENDALPVQLTLGHGGTKVEETIVDPDLFPYVSLQVGRTTTPLRRGLSTNALHGFALMDRNPAGIYDVAFYSLDTVAGATVVLDYFLSIPRGPRLKPEPTATPSMPPASAPVTQDSSPTANGIVSPDSTSSVPQSFVSWQCSLLIAISVPLTTLLL